MDAFQRVLDEMREMHDRKQADYGTGEDPFANVRASEGFGIPPWLGAIVRLNDKITRIKSFAKKGTLANESLRDSLIDIAVYATIAVALYDEPVSARNDDAAARHRAVELCNAEVPDPEVPNQRISTHPYRPTPNLGEIVQRVRDEAVRISPIPLDNTRFGARDEANRGS